MPRNARDGFLIELEKYGHGQRDLTPNINFFSKVEVSKDIPAALTLESGPVTLNGIICLLTCVQDGLTTE